MSKLAYASWVVLWIVLFVLFSAGPTVITFFLVHVFAPYWVAVWGSVLVGIVASAVFVQFVIYIGTKTQGSPRTVNNIIHHK